MVFLVDNPACLPYFTKHISIEKPYPFMEKRAAVPRTLGQAFGLWVAFVFVFILFGGLGAGITSLIFEAAFGEFNDVLYAVVFGAHGIIAYQLLIRWFEQRA